MPASLFYPDSAPAATASAVTSSTVSSDNFTMDGNAEQLAFQLAMLQGSGHNQASGAANGHGPTPSSAVGGSGLLQTGWSTGENGVSRQMSMPEDRPTQTMQHFMASNGHSSSGATNGFRAGSMEDLKLPPQRKSQNMTECVPVPTSEHVAEIVGRQGCKIKALRAKTNTYIKTPVRGEEPVFVVTGRKEDVGLAKREILSAADHFSQIRASRKSNVNSTLAFGHLVANQPGQTTVQVRVPYRVVGLVVGPKGATIKRIQQQTRTYIVTPSRDKEPVFEVTGLPENVEVAKKEIEAHIAFRTGSSDAGSAEGSTSGGFGAFGTGSGNGLNDNDDNVFSSSNGSSLLSSGESMMSRPGEMARHGGGHLGHGGHQDHYSRMGMFNGGSGSNQDPRDQHNHHHNQQQQHSHHQNHLHHQMGNNNFNSSAGGHDAFGNHGHQMRQQQRTGQGSPFGANASSSEQAALAAAAAAAAANGKGLTLQNILDQSNHFDLMSNGINNHHQQNGHHHHNLFDGSAPNGGHGQNGVGGGWGDSQDSGISNSPPFAGGRNVGGISNSSTNSHQGPLNSTANSQAAAVERSGSGIWGDLNINKALSGMKISGDTGLQSGGFSGRPDSGSDNALTRASVDLGTLGHRPNMIPLTSSNSLTLIGGSSDMQTLNNKHTVSPDLLNNTAMPVSGGQAQTPSMNNQHHPAVIPTSSTGSSSVASLSEMSPPNSMPHFNLAGSSTSGNSSGGSAVNSGSASAGPASGDEKDQNCLDDSNLKKLYMMRSAQEELLRQNNDLNEKSSFDS